MYLYDVTLAYTGRARNVVAGPSHYASCEVSFSPRLKSQLKASRITCFIRERKSKMEVASFLISGSNLFKAKMHIKYLVNIVVGLRL